MGNLLTANELTSYLDEERLIGLFNGDATKAWTATENAAARAEAEKFIGIGEMELKGILKSKIANLASPVVSDELKQANAHVALHRKFQTKPEFRNVMKVECDEALEWARGIRDSEEQIGADVTEASLVKSVFASRPRDRDCERDGTFANGGIGL